MEMIDLFFITLLFLAFIVALGLGAKEGWKMLFPERKKLISSADRGAYSDNTTTRQQLLHHFVEATGNSNHKMIDFWGPFAVDYLVEQLKENYKNFTEVTSICSLGKISCETIIRFDTSKGSPVLLKIYSYHTDIEATKNKPSYTTEEFDIEDYATENNQINIAHQVHMMFSNKLDQDSPEIADVLFDIQDAKLDQVEHKVENMTTRLYRLAINSLGTSYLDEFFKNVTKETDQYYDLAYNKIGINYNGETHEVSMAKALKIACFGLENGENLYISGGPGTGKSKLKDLIQAHLFGLKNVNLIEITPGIIQELQTAAGQTGFLKAFKDKIQNGQKNIIFIDEAERLMARGNDDIHTENTELILQILDGSLQKELNCSTVLVFNATPNKLNPALFRRGRVGLHFELTPLLRAQADQLVNYLREHSQKEKFFDSAEYARILEDMSTLIPGENHAYAQVGQITLGDVYDCFLGFDKKALIVNMLREEAGIALPERPPAAEEVMEKASQPSPAASSKPTMAEPTLMVSNVEAAPKATINSFKKSRKKNRDRRRNNK